MSVSIPGNIVKTGSGSAGSASGRGTHHLFAAGQLVPFILVTFLFFLWGIPNNLNDVLIRQFMKLFSISRFQAHGAMPPFTWVTSRWPCQPPW